MTPERLQRLRAALGAALDLPEPERRAFARTAAAGDVGFERELHALLVDAERDDPRLEPLIPLSARAVADAQVRTDERIGPWRLLSPLGHGGMGDVWLAERADGVYAQRVAIKLPHAFGADAAANARFERERALLAELEHPGIARLVDGGFTAAGRPWLAMEYVDGRRIDEHVAAHELDQRARVMLLLEVTRVLAAAHRQRIVHRDLKPANVLVRADGRVVLIDFGIAAMLDVGATGGVAPLATPRFAAPEQLRGEAASTASDVYSLGLLGRELVPSADADLAAVFLAALPERPEQRTPSATAFAAELERWLAHRPVEARRASPWHRFRLFARRNPLAAGALLLLVSTVGAALVVTTRLWRSEARERAQVAAAKAALDERYAQVRELVGELVFGVHDRVATLGGAVPVRAFLIERAEDHLGRLAADAADDPALAREVVEVLSRLADVRGSRTQGHHGDLEGALRSARQASLIASEHAARRPADASWCVLEARTRRQVGDLLRARGDLTAARGEYEAASAAMTRGRSLGATERELERTAAVIDLQLGKLDVAEGAIEQGLVRLQRVAAEFERIWQRDRTAREPLRDVVLAWSEQAYARTLLGQDGAASTLWAQAVAALGAVAAADDQQLARDRIEFAIERALCEAQQGKADEAIAALAPALASARTMVREDRGNLLAERLLQRALLRAARVANALGDAAPAATYYREVEPLLRETAQRCGGADRDVTIDLAESLIGRAEAERRLMRSAGVAAAFDEGLALLASGDALQRRDHVAGNLMTVAWLGLANLSLSTGDVVEALSRCERSREPIRAWADGFPDLSWTLRHLGVLESTLGNAAAAAATDESLPLEQRCARLDVAAAAFERGLAVVERLRAAGRLSAGEARLPLFLTADLERVRQHRAALKAAAGPGTDR